MSACILVVLCSTIRGSVVLAVEDLVVLAVVADDGVRPPLVPNGCLTMRMGGDKCCCFPCLIPR